MTEAENRPSMPTVQDMLTRVPEALARVGLGPDRLHPDQALDIAAYVLTGMIHGSERDAFLARFAVRHPTEVAALAERVAFKRLVAQLEFAVDEQVILGERGTRNEWIAATERQEVARNRLNEHVEQLRRRSTVEIPR